MSLYDDLEIDKKADKKTIQKAFHKLAKKYHPDKKGGDVKKMQKINKAYRTLKDDVKRLHYDRTGEEAQADNYMQSVIMMAQTLLEQIITVNPLDIKKDLKEMKKRTDYNSTNRIQSLERQKNKYEKFIKRIKKAPDNNIIQFYIEAKLQAFSKDIYNEEIAYKKMLDAIKLLQDYEYYEIIKPSVFDDDIIITITGDYHG